MAPHRSQLSWQRVASCPVSVVISRRHQMPTAVRRKQDACGRRRRRGEAEAAEGHKQYQDLSTVLILEKCLWKLLGGWRRQACS
jgi:hypothetical protein